MLFAAGGLAEELCDALPALYLCFRLSHTPTHIGKRTLAQDDTGRFSVMWLVKCKIPSLQLEGNRFDEIPFSPRGASEAWGGMVEHGTARLLSPHTQ